MHHVKIGMNQNHHVARDQKDSKAKSIALSSSIQCAAFDFLHEFCLDYMLISNPCNNAEQKALLTCAHTTNIVQRINLLVFAGSGYLSDKYFLGLKYTCEINILKTMF
jgi:hypothetical protein